MDHDVALYLVIFLTKCGTFNISRNHAEICRDMVSEVHCFSLEPTKLLQGDHATDRHSELFFISLLKFLSSSSDTYN